MAKKSACGGPKRPDPKTVPVKGHNRSTPNGPCKGSYPKPGPKTVSVGKHKRSKP